MSTQADEFLTINILLTFYYLSRREGIYSLILAFDGDFKLYVHAKLTIFPVSEPDNMQHVPCPVYPLRQDLVYLDS